MPSGRGASALASCARASTFIASATPMGIVCARRVLPKTNRGFLLGHADVEMQNKVYGHDGPGLHRLQTIVEKLHYPGLRKPMDAKLDVAKVPAR
jgi:hypothetical protein